MGVIKNDSTKSRLPSAERTLGLRALRMFVPETKSMVRGSKKQYLFQIRLIRPATRCSPG
jgi:hypothetical protein